MSTSRGKLLRQAMQAAQLRSFLGMFIVPHASVASSAHTAYRAPSLTLDPVEFVDNGSGEVLVTERSTPGDVAEPIVVHLVDWADEPEAFSISLANTMFGGTNHVWRSLVGCTLAAWHR